MQSIDSRNLFFFTPGYLLAEIELQFIALRDSRSPERVTECRFVFVFCAFQNRTVL